MALRLHLRHDRSRLRHDGCTHRCRSFPLLSSQHWRTATVGSSARHCFLSSLHSVSTADSDCRARWLRSSCPTHPVTTRWERCSLLRCVYSGTSVRLQHRQDATRRVSWVEANHSPSFFGRHLHVLLDWWRPDRRRLDFSSSRRPGCCQRSRQFTQSVTSVHLSCCALSCSMIGRIRAAGRREKR
jgi:hypothetical protein